ncbi:MAG: response regulator, partial [Bacteroidales bacterium]|nr:response regulator [Bacteroidales bacterium]
DLLHKSDFVDLQITSDARKCRHILQNLIGNAVKFTEKGKVEISAQQTEGNLAITVTDTGIGISSYYLPHIFDEFRQADDSASRKFGGTGLGLAIAKKYANMLGGKIIAASTYGKGSDFTLIVPLHYKAQHRKTETQASSDFNLAINKTLLKPALDLPGKTILLVEDSESAIIQIKDFLEESGYQMLVAHDGAEALAIVSHTIPDAIILDLMMPGIDGFEVLKILRNEEHATRIPVLILTAKHVTKEELKSLKENNIYQLIQKGDVNRKEMLKALETMTFPEAKEVLKPQRVRQAIVGKPVVLVVEDNPDNMLALKALLADDYIVIEANDGNEGVEKAKTHKPNLILMDIALPEMDGIEAFKDIRKDAGLLHIPVVALTASAMTADRENILSYGFDAFLAKPIDEQLFFKTINEILYGK